jgi:uncharacterized membrane protein YeiH
VLSSELYAIPALIGAGVVVVPERLGVGGPAWAFVGAGACLTIRLLGVRFRIDAPHPPGGNAAGQAGAGPGLPERED